MIQTLINRRAFNFGLLGVLPFGGILLTEGCGTLSEFVKYFDLGVAALDAALPTIIGTSSSSIISWANQIATAFNSASGILEGSANSLTKASQIATLFDQIVLPKISGLPASVTTEVGKIIAGVDQFLASLGLTQTGTAQSLSSNAVAPHVPTRSVNIKVTITDKNVLILDQQKLQAILAATK